MLYRKERMKSGNRELENLTAKNTTSTPNASQSTSEAVASVGSHCGLCDFQRLAQSRDFEHIKAGSKEKVAMRQISIDSREFGQSLAHENFTGFFSNFFPSMAADIMGVELSVKGP